MLRIVLVMLVCATGASSVGAAEPSTLVNIGNPLPAGTVTAVATGFDLTAGGADIGGTRDSFAFYYETVSGDFDVRVRVETVTLSDAFAKAGLVVRDTFGASNRFSAALATPSIVGSLFQARATTNGTATLAGSFPVNYPFTWLRLRRVGNQFTGFAGYDGQAWSQLGTATIAMPADVFLGVGLCSHTNARPATAKFRDYGPAESPTLGNPASTVEPPGPSSRKTGLAITEIHYKPPPGGTNGPVLDFVEIFNSNPFFEDISGFRFTGDIEFTFPPNTVIPGGGYLVVAKAPADIIAAYAITNVIGPFTNNLPTDGLVRLRNQVGHIYLEVPYNNLPPWPVAADGTGHTLTLLRPSYGEGQPQAWGISDQVGGSPGRQDTVRGGPLRNVVINEFLANSDDGLEDYIELYNHSNEDIDLAGCILTDDPHINKFVIPAGTTIPARGFVTFGQSQLNFGLNAGGEKIYLWNPDRTRVLDVIAFEAQASGISSGRFPDGAAAIYPLRDRSSNAPNSAILIRDIVINEIMYKPISTDNNDEYVELYNKGTNTVDLSGWRFIAGIDYTFPSNTFLAPDSYLVVAENLPHLLAKYGGALTTANTYGNYRGSLANRGERLALAMPDISYTTNSQNEVSTNVVYVVVDEVTYGTGGAWGSWANEGGSSLELMDSHSDRRLAMNWGDSDETAKAPWMTLEFTGPLDNGAGIPNFLEIAALGEGEYLFDDAEVMVRGTNYVTPANSTFDSGLGAWINRGTHVRSTLSETEGFGGGSCLHIRASARGDAIVNRNLCPLIASVPTTVSNVTLRAKVRWLRGWPELLIRLHGNYIEAVDRLAIPANLGTPGARNSRAIANKGPAIYQMAHSPVVPAANQNVVVSARVHDSDGTSSISLRYRVDPSSNHLTRPMVDDGTDGDLVAGDGIFSATISGQPQDALVAFFVEASDPFAARSVFPLDAPQFEALVRFGDPVVGGGFGTYRQWFTTNAVRTWINRPVMSNERIFGTFVYGNFRAIYNHSSKYSGSPYHQGFTSPVNSGCHYSIELPLDDILLGTENMNKVHAPGNGPFDDGVNQREQTVYWFARQMGLPWNYRRFVNMFVNGNRRGGTTHLMEDTETPGNDVVESRWPDDPDGHLYKLQPWFEADDRPVGSVPFANNSWCELDKFITTGGAHKKARYRWNYLVRAAKSTANDFDPVFKLIDAATNPTSNQQAWFNGLNTLANLEQWMRTFAVHHAVGDWDHFGSQNSQNMYGYVPQNGRWEIMLWDFNIVLGNSGSWGAGQNLFVVNAADQTMPRLYSNPISRRAYFRALKELANGPMNALNVVPVIRAKHNALLASGITAADPTVIETWINSARTAIINTVGTEDAQRFTVSNVITTNGNLVLITGNAPVEAATILVNGMTFPVVWTSTRSFSIQVPVDMATNVISLQGYDLRGNALTGFSTNVVVNYAGPIDVPQGNVMFSEIMYNPAIPGASYVEIHNASPMFSFDLSGWRINGLDFTFPSGSFIGARRQLAVAKNQVAFGQAYGANVSLAGEFAGELDTDGETLTLLQPGPSEDQDAVIDKVRYEAAAPWLSTPAGSAIALQLIDPAQDNSRVSNWGDGRGWRFFSHTANINPSTNQFRFYLGSAGQIYVDSISFVAGAVPEVGQNLILNGDFEGPFHTNDGGPWSFSQPSLSNTVISTDFVYAGNGSLQLVHQIPGPSSFLIQNGIEISTAGPYTISFWYYPITNNTTLTAYINSAYRPSTNVRLTQFTPGAPNNSSATLPPYPPLWLNELQANNITGVRDTSNTA
ncbi:MAG: lamin tail domain-containing protein, partial [Verrucomicrobia subdivision 3 bacterium]|nr:lamin tail domain-containing protein [Limisphaerales bacterium]